MLAYNVSRLDAKLSPENQIPKRELTLVDKSQFAVRLTLWGKQAEQYNAEPNAVIAFKGVRVGDFGGECIPCSSINGLGDFKL